MTDCIRCWKLTDKPVETPDGEAMCLDCYIEIYTGEADEPALVGQNGGAE